MKKLSTYDTGCTQKPHCSNTLHDKKNWESEVMWFFLVCVFRYEDLHCYRLKNHTYSFYIVLYLVLQTEKIFGHYFWTEIISKLI